MKRFLIITLFVAVLAVLGVAFGLPRIVSAQGGTAPTPTPWAGQGFGPGMMGGYAGNGGYGPMHEYMQAALAEKLGLTETELEQLYAKGQTFWQIASDKGFTAAQASQMMIDARNTALDKMVAGGVITKDQAEWMKTRMGGMMGGGYGGAGNGGCMGGFGGQTGSGTTAPRGMGRGMMGGRW